MKEFDGFSFPRNYSGKVPLFSRKFPEKFRRKFPEISELTTLPQTEVPDPKTEVPDPQTELPDPKMEVSDSKTEVPDPQAEVPDLGSG